ncbi:MAG: hypothetical protein WCN87_03160, partial [Chlamydiota bacterium]
MGINPSNNNPSWKHTANAPIDRKDSQDQSSSDINAGKIRYKQLSPESTASNSIFFAIKSIFSSIITAISKMLFKTAQEVKDIKGRVTVIDNPDSPLDNKIEAARFIHLALAKKPSAISLQEADEHEAKNTSVLLQGEHYEEIVSQYNPSQGPKMLKIWNQAYDMLLDKTAEKLLDKTAEKENTALTEKSSLRYPSASNAKTELNDQRALSLFNQKKYELIVGEPSIFFDKVSEKGKEVYRRAYDELTKESYTTQGARQLKPASAKLLLQHISKRYPK